MPATKQKVSRDQVSVVEIPQFVFSSRRRHTRSDRDWSSDMCSSDLRRVAAAACPDADPAKVAHLAHLHATEDPFTLAARIDRQLPRLYALANHRRGGQPMDAARP